MVRVRLWVKADYMHEAHEACERRGVKIVKEVAALHSVSHMIVDAKTPDVDRIVRWFCEPPPPRPQPFPAGALLYYRMEE